MIPSAVPTTIDFVTTAKGRVSSMEEPAKVVYFAKCSHCGKLTFVDLLDESMLCEYCREQGRTRLSRRKMHEAQKKLRLHKTAVGNNK